MAAAFQLLLVLTALTVKTCDTEELNRVTSAFQDTGKELVAELESIRGVLGPLSRQVMLQQLFVEERIRSEGHSGVKQVRHGREGTRNYYSDTHGNSGRLMAIHEHANNIRTVGLGEFIGVLNGVEFRTRHNDYRLYMANKTSKDYHATEEIPFPEVPPEVKNKLTVDEQIVEMREWFKAWKSQNYTVRDYRKYFKPVLCYLEGAWTTATKDIDEPFESDRHFIDAKSWFDLQEKVRFTSYTGRKDNLENFSFLPTTIMEIINGTIPVFAQWNYRILCHPLSRDVPLNRFRVVDEFQSRLPSRRKYEEQTSTRAARFQLNPKDSDKWSEGINNPKFTLLDEIMSEIPGKDNYQGSLTDEAFGLPAHTLDPKKTGKLNVAYYHRWFKVLEKDAMGQSIRHRGYSDENLFMAMTTQPKVAGMKMTTCKGPKRNPRCTSITQKFSYAIPLEIIYLTPLNRWNPFDLEYKGSERTAYGKTVFQFGRYGGRTPDKAYNGTNSKKYYQTPSAFFSGKEVSTDAADTTKNSVGVLDRNGDVKITRASGIRIFFPPINDVGVLRQRYPIMPVHGEGSSVWKELEATKDLLMNSKSYGYMYREPLVGSGVVPTEPTERPLTLKMEDATKTPPGAHTHEITLTADEVKDAKGKGSSFLKTTTQGASHQHQIRVAWRNNQWKILRCDSYDQGAYRCKDKHGMYLNENVSV
ncbi:uncharacterized protein LOC110062447 [Orbicella faveolata]|uniref:uncharacterized protein LOC110062447 n=1 Tax=Orbicella faveolata TaxID=48498 RepID=UPI0009E23C8C|nr:uncharacterized protein LOC110062447 [Orbicella faveolata]